jgi:hypothetical protein
MSRHKKYNYDHVPIRARGGGDDPGSRDVVMEIVAHNLWAAAAITAKEDRPKPAFTLAAPPGEPHFPMCWRSGRSLQPLRSSGWRAASTRVPA